MTLFLVLFVLYLIGCVLNYELLLGWWDAMFISCHKETEEFKKQAILCSLGSWLSVVATFPAVGYGKFGLKFK